MKTALPNCLALSAVLCVAGSNRAEGVEWEKDILPIIKESCYKCHGEGNKKAGVNLDAEQIESAFGDTIVPGDLEKSELYTSLLPDADEVMPPRGKAPAVSPEDVEKIKQWILAGAPLEGTGTPPGVAGSPFGSRPAPISGDWTNKEGTTITATLLRVEGETAILQMAGGKIYNYPIANLSEESQAKVREFAAAAAKDS